MWELPLRKVQLKSVQTNSGFLERCSVAFAPQLTCIIGARGTCKSTVVESIRFAFDADRERIIELTQPNGLITKTLGAGSVKCTVLVEEEGQLAEYTIEREVDGTPRVLRDGTRDTLGEDLLHEIEIYSQSALQQIASADKPQLRLQLIDRPNRVEILRARGEINARSSLCTWISRPKLGFREWGRWTRERRTSSSCSRAVKKPLNIERNAIGHC